ncbi:MAG TPA: hypothetical protein DDX92_06975 [Flavobacteriales bacterium]|jgi:hypothetical protein|nr:hypothetical protein [Flavobacteriales bacterium]
MKTAKLIALLLILQLTLSAQYFPKEEYYSKPVVWLGLDFTLTQFKNPFDFPPGEELQRRYMPGWNEMIIIEPDKYNIRKFLKNENISYSLTEVNAFNEQIDPAQIFSEEKELLTLEKLEEDVSKYENGKDELAVMMYVVSFNKTIPRGTFYFVVIDRSSGRLMFVEKVSADPGGFGLRNYWLGSYHRALKQLRYRMREWRR